MSRRSSAWSIRGKTAASDRRHRCGEVSHDPAPPAVMAASNVAFKLEDAAYGNLSSTLIAGGVVRRSFCCRREAIDRVPVVAFAIFLDQRVREAIEDARAERLLHRIGDVAPEIPVKENPTHISRGQAVLNVSWLHGKRRLSGTISPHLKHPRVVRQ